MDPISNLVACTSLGDFTELSICASKMHSSKPRFASQCKEAIFKISQSVLVHGVGDFVCICKCVLALTCQHEMGRKHPFTYSHFITVLRHILVFRANPRQFCSLSLDLVFSNRGSFSTRDPIYRVAKNQQSDNFIFLTLLKPCKNVSQCKEEYKSVLELHWSGTFI